MLKFLSRICIRIHQGSLLDNRPSYIIRANLPIAEPVRWRGDGDDVLLGAAAVAAARAGTPPHVPRRHRRQPHQPRHPRGDICD